MTASQAADKEISVDAAAAAVFIRTGRHFHIKGKALRTCLGGKDALARVYFNTAAHRSEATRE